MKLGLLGQYKTRLGDQKKLALGAITELGLVGQYKIGLVGQTKLSLG